MGSGTESMVHGTWHMESDTETIVQVYGWCMENNTEHGEHMYGEWYIEHATQSVVQEVWHMEHGSRRVNGAKFKW